MKLIVRGFLFLLTMILINCSSVRKDDENSSDITALSLSSKIQLVKADDRQLFEMDENLIVFYYQDLTLYQISIPHTFSTIITNKNGDVVSQNFLKEEMRYQYFIHKNDDSVGFKFDSLSLLSGHKLKIDSFLSKKAVTSFKKFYNKTNDSLTETIKMPDSIVIEKYIPKIKYDDSYGDTTYLYFSNDLNLKMFDFSFSKEIESIKHMKLFKIRYIYNLISNENHSLDIPKREFLFELKRIPVNEPEKIISIFNEYKKIEQ